VSHVNGFEKETATKGPWPGKRLWIRARSSSTYLKTKRIFHQDYFMVCDWICQNKRTSCWTIFGSHPIGFKHWVFLNCISISYQEDSEGGADFGAT